MSETWELNIFSRETREEAHEKDKEVGQAENFYAFKAIAYQLEHFYMVLNDFCNNIERQSSQITELQQVSVNNTRNTNNRGNKQNKTHREEVGDSASEHEEDT